jgi:uncharacterized Zn-binding protein involved in type VI secretion
MMLMGYYINQGDKTTCGGQVLDGDPTISWDGLSHALEGHRVSCGKDGKVYKICGGDPTFTNMGIKVAGTLDSFSGCPCRAQIIPTILTATYSREVSSPLQASRAAAQPVSPTAPHNSRDSAQSSFSPPATAVDSSQACVFAKSCVSVPAGSTDAGTAPEPASNFGSTALLASTGAAGGLGRVAGTLGRELGSWTFKEVIAQAGARLNVVLLALWPRDIGDSTLYTPEQLANMRAASTRVRFQFRRDAEGAMQVYGLHTKPGSGTDRVPVTQANWNANKSAMTAVLDGISITWTPNNGPVVNHPSPYPGTPERLDNLLVHPIAPGQDTQISHYPGQDADNLTWQDTIIVFPADSGVPPLYLVFSKPAYHQAPKTLIAFLERSGPRRKAMYKAAEK